MPTEQAEFQTVKFVGFKHLFEVQFCELLTSYFLKKKHS